MDPPADAHSPTSIRRSAPDAHGADSRASLILMADERFPDGVQAWDELDGSAPKPTLYLNGTKDAHRAKGLLEKYAIDFEERHTPEPFVSLHWNGTTYTDLFGIADFLMFAGRLSLPGMRTRDRTDDGAAPWFPDTPLVIRVRTASDARGRSSRRARVPSRSGEPPRSA